MSVQLPFSLKRQPWYLVFLLLLLLCRAGSESVSLLLLLLLQGCLQGCTHMRSLGMRGCTLTCTAARPTRECGLPTAAPACSAQQR